MERENLISISRFCDYHRVELSFLDSLNASGLISFVLLENEHYIPLDEISAIEKMITLHYELDINIEGIEAISHLLQRVNTLQQELSRLQNRLGLYEK